MVERVPASLGPVSADGWKPLGTAGEWRSLARNWRAQLGNLESAAMLFFVDESWQTIGTQDVGSLGAMALPQIAYNRFCREFFGMKRRILGAQELRDSEIRGQHAFSKSAFKRQELHSDSHWLAAIDALFRLLQRYDARTFVIWTKNPEYSTLRTSLTTNLSKPYKQLLFDFRAFMEREGRGRLGSLNFDQRGLREDAAVGTAVANFLVRTNAGWDKYFVQIPNFTVSAVSPGLQAADVVAHLGAHLADPRVRPELGAYVGLMKDLRYEFSRPQRRVRCTREIV
jgi:hypothetical protein